ncbi:hypothetical protein NW759_016792 [Fusarium solani]|nr:hypothetical protein NW759_016792 [Fusarium solani]
MGLLLSTEDLPLKLIFAPSSQSSAILNPWVFFLSTEDLLPMPVSAGSSQIRCNLESMGLLSMVGLPLQSIFARSSRSVQSRGCGSSSIRRRSPTLTHLCTFLTLQCNLGSVGLLSVHGRSPIHAHLCTFSQTSFFETQCFSK